MALLCQQQVDTQFPRITSLYVTAPTIELDDWAFRQNADSAVGLAAPI
jgi:hypothetical protein